MFKYEKMLEYPVNIRKKDIKMAKNLVAQLGGAYFKRDLERNQVQCIINAYTLESEVKRIADTSTVLKKVRLLN